MSTTLRDKQELAHGVKELFSQRDSYIIIGLTGRTGSGCSTAAKILQKNFSSINLLQPANPFKNNEQRKYSVISEWAKENWKPFTVINVSSIIFAHLAMLPEDEFRKIVSIECAGPAIEEIVSILKSVKSLLEKYKLSDYITSDIEDEAKVLEVQEVYKFYFTDLENYLNNFRKLLNAQKVSAYTAIMQAVGDNIRCSGNAGRSEPDHKNIFFTLPKFINQMIKLGRRVNKITGSKDYFVIDAIRNPFEVEFFKGRFSAFYLFAITANEACRKRRLHALNYTDSEIDRISQKEYPKKDNLKTYEILVSQHIGKCLELADVIVENPDSETKNVYDVLSESIVKYVSLIQHPGLISPNRVERCMQVAITAKLSSGCISRQVGAVVTDYNYSIRAVGWNSVPQGQVPCNLRNIKRLSDRTDVAAFSDFERNSPEEEFKDAFDSLPHLQQAGYAIDGRPLSYCFKSTYNLAKGDKNQVHTRSLHAEENAFLQITKYGGQGIEGGILFTTASPCELCSKKAYQLGILKIYYIDPYPGIASKHILSCGENQPQLQLFTGAIGRAYVQIYQPLVPFKDELEILMAARETVANEE